MSSFESYWLGCGAVLLALAIYIGWTSTGRYAGVLIDSRGRFSLTHLQVVAWTLLILSAYLGALLAAGFDHSQVRLSSELLSLMGIAAGSAVLSTGVKSAKDDPQSRAVVRKMPAPRTVPGADAVAPAAPRARLAQIWLDEEGRLADQVVDIAKFQNLIFTLVACFTFVALALKTDGLPLALPEHLVTLLGISHAGYVGGKIPNKS